MVVPGTFVPDLAGGDEELRIAPVMTGGSSLAVWMGGATAELYRVVRAREEDATADAGMQLYRDLLEITRRTARVDVITGTSAGGLNGSLLAAATYLELGSDAFLGIGDTWLEVGDLEKLLWKNSKADPPSLFQGDDYFRLKVQETIRSWADEMPVPDRREPLEVDLMTTLTTFTPEPRGRFDDYGEEINEVDHAQTLWFKPEHFGADRWVERLSIATPTSASLPAVFEPSFIPTSKVDAVASGRPNFKENASFENSRWAVDGGVVVNLPLTEALDRVFDRYGVGEIKRVALYVSPTPGQFRRARPDSPDAMPSIRDALVTTVQAPRAEGVAADLAAIHKHNLMVERQAESRQHLAPLIDQLVEGGSRATDLYDRYGEVRAAASVEAMLGSIAGRLGHLPRSYHELQVELSQARRDWLPESLSHISRGGSSEGAEGWAWGIAPVEQALSSALRLTGLLLAAVPPPPAVEGPGLSAPADEHAETRIRVWAAQANLHHWRARTSAVRRIDRDYWLSRFEDLEASNRRKKLETPGAVKDWAVASYDGWPGERRKTQSPSEEPTPTRRRGEPKHVESEASKRLRTLRDWALNELQSAHEATAETLERLRPVVLSFDGPDANRIARQAVDEYVALTGSVIARSPWSQHTTQIRLRAIHVAQSLVLPRIVDREQAVTLMQLSWNAKNRVVKRSPDDKLAGPELGRLGAFMKPSWRANDWFWGRMDAADRLVLLLLDPVRLRRLGVDADHLAQSELGRLIDRQEAEAALAPGSTATAMPASAGRIAKEIQTDIASTELVRVAEQVKVSAKSGGDESASETWADEVIKVGGSLKRVPEAQVPQYLDAMHIGTETVRDELGSSLFNRVVSRTAAVAVNALTGEHAKIPVLPRVLRPLRAPVHATNGLVTWLTQATPLGRAVLALVLAVSGAIVALAIGGANVPPGSLAISLIVLTGSIVVAMLRIGFKAVAVSMLFLATIVGLTLTGEDLEAVVYSEPDTETAVTLGADSRLEIPAGTVIDITVDSGDATVDQDVIVDGDASITLRTGEAVAVEVAQGQPFVEAWKRYGVTNFFGALRLFALLGLALLFFHALKQPTADSSPSSVSPAGDHETGKAKQSVWLVPAVGLALIVIVIGGPALGEVVFTGAPGSNGVKDWFVELAANFETYGLEVLLVAFVGISMVLSLFTPATTWLREHMPTWLTEREKKTRKAQTTTKEPST